MVIVQQFGILFILGMLGIVMFTLTSIPLVEQQLNALPPGLNLPPIEVILLAQMLQSGLLLAIAIFLGIACANRVKLQSYLVDLLVFKKPKPSAFNQELKISLGVGVVTATVILGLNYLLDPTLPEALRIANHAEPHFIRSLTAILYGGITEEILMRWGLMSLLVWGSWKLTRRGNQLPSRSNYYFAIAIAALVFGVLHLPFTATIAPLTPMIIIRALLLNGVGGLAYGWLFWQYSLEAAMLAHASFHILALIINLVI